MTARAEFSVWGTSAVVVVGDPLLLREATATLRAELAAFDDACSWFRDDSELSRLPRGRAARISPLLADALDVALRAAQVTDGLVDPTVADALRGQAYDRDFAVQPGNDPRPAETHAVPGWHRVALDLDRDEVLLPPGVNLDLGATGKALVADRAAALIAEVIGSGVLVSIGGDYGTAGQPPKGGWQIAISDDHRTAERAPWARVAITGGGLATSSIARRRWHRGGRAVHHVIDPRTGRSATEVWRTVSVAAESCVDANTASTAALVLGGQAPAWLADRHLPALLVAVDGAVLTVGDWPVRDRVVA
ncbi:FAD:protein FMN transferase [Actinokineospora inagensis]|uniref:FAD:protein FMN transferase n=1 Tax=Actinokineospora inagensis TaxID=103730 RepID=UPI000479BEEF|nr:FAD:protein FMN transferase [Actinokineospora inagensis]